MNKKEERGMEERKGGCPLAVEGSQKLLLELLEAPVELYC